MRRSSRADWLMIHCSSEASDDIDETIQRTRCTENRTHTAAQLPQTVEDVRVRQIYSYLRDVTREARQEISGCCTDKLLVTSIAVVLRVTAIVKRKSMRAQRIGAIAGSLLNCQAGRVAQTGTRGHTNLGFLYTARYLAGAVGPSSLCERFASRGRSPPVR